MSISTWLITGASSGLAYALAEHVLKQGDQVVLVVRNYRISADRLANGRIRPFEIRPVNGWEGGGSGR
jgi:NAD(P)-dependent dehydrogenase (short-subunit alcohol dehydrogenase family)